MAEARAQVEQTRAELSRYTVYAPFSGGVLQVECILASSHPRARRISHSC